MLKLEDVHTSYGSSQVLFGVTMTRHGMMQADRNEGKLGLWMKLMDRLNLGFAC